jgi:hypothetical protein
MSAGAVDASASTAVTVKFFEGADSPDGAGSVYVDIIVNGVQGGLAFWEANGDTIKVQDTASDGVYIAAYLSTSPVREASTAGHPAPSTITAGGDLPEGTNYSFWTCAVTGGEEYCSPIYSVHS